MTQDDRYQWIDTKAEQQIMDSLATIERDNTVKILFAIESGSRAWGFPSPDSDYDVRFVYVHPRDWYLSLNPGRDVIELPIEGDMDINGWDLKKALGLLLKPNPVLLEWLASPIRYRWNDDACAQLQTLATQTTHGLACLHHYLNLGARQNKTYMERNTQVHLKKYFYSIRPAMAVRWLRLYPERPLPMSLSQFRKDLDLPDDLSTELDRLITLKRRTREMGTGDRIAVIDAFLKAEFDWAEGKVKNLKNTQPDLTAEAETLFRGQLT